MSEKEHAGRELSLFNQTFLSLDQVVLCAKAAQEEMFVRAKNYRNCRVFLHTLTVTTKVEKACQRTGKKSVSLWFQNKKWRNIQLSPRMNKIRSAPDSCFR